MSKEVPSGEYGGIYFSKHPQECHIYGAEDEIQVHHIDGDRGNNTVDNLIPACFSCHWGIHSARDALKGWTQKLNDPPTRMGPTKRLTVDFDDELYKEFSKAVIDEDTNKAAVVRTLVQGWVNDR